MNRRTFLSWAAGAVAAPRLGFGRELARPVRLYATVGLRIDVYDLDLEPAAIRRRQSIEAPANVQYAWPHASRRFLYVVSSNGGPGLVGTTHYASAFRIDPVSGALSPHGLPVPLRSRPIHVTTDIPSEHLLVAHNNPSWLTVLRIEPDGSLGREVQQPGLLDCGIYAHQVRVAPSNRSVILVTRGNDAANGKPEDPGALKVFRFERGLLTDESSVAPNGGYGFGPRHLDFHPTLPLVYVSLERQNQLDVFRLQDARLGPAPLFQTTMLGSPKTNVQRAGTVHVHPSGRFVYGVNRAGVDINRPRIFPGGENTLAVFAIDPRTGRPRPIQHIDTGGLEARTFHIDPSGRVLVAANMVSMTVSKAGSTRSVPAGLSLFGIGADGRLTYIRKTDVDVGGASLFWMGMV